MRERVAYLFMIGILVLLIAVVFAVLGRASTGRHRPKNKGTSRKSSWSDGGNVHRLKKFGSFGLSFRLRPALDADLVGAHLGMPPQQFAPTAPTMCSLERVARYP